MTFQCILFGPSASGKSALINYHRNCEFIPEHLPTDGLYLYFLHVNDFSIKIWECTEPLVNPKFQQQLFKNTSLAIVALDLSQDLDVDYITNILKFIKDYDPLMPIILVGTKKDLDRKINDETFLELQRQYKIHHSVTTSAHNAEGKDELNRVLEIEIIEQKRLEELRNSPLEKIKQKVAKNSLLYLALCQFEELVDELTPAIKYQLINAIDTYIINLSQLGNSDYYERVTSEFIRDYQLLLKSEKIYLLPANTFNTVKNTSYSIEIALGIIVLSAGNAFLLGLCIGVAVTGLTLASLTIGVYMSAFAALISVPFALKYAYDNLIAPSKIEQCIANLAETGLSTKDYHENFFAPVNTVSNQIPITELMEMQLANPLNTLKNGVKEDSLLYQALCHLEKSIEELNPDTKLNLITLVDQYLRSLNNRDNIELYEELSNQFILDYRHILQNEKIYGLSSSTIKAVKKGVITAEIALGVVALAAGNGFLVGGLVGLIVTGLTFATLLVASYLAAVTAIISLPFAIKFAFDYFKTPNGVDSAVKNLTTVGATTRDHYFHFFTSGLNREESNENENNMSEKITIKT